MKNKLGNAGDNGLQPFKQNEDYSGNFLDKVRKRINKRKERKKTLISLAQKEIKINDVVTILWGRWAHAQAQVAEIEGDQYFLVVSIFKRPTLVGPVSRREISLNDEQSPIFSEEEIEKALSGSTISNKYYDPNDNSSELINDISVEEQNTSLNPKFNEEYKHMTFPDYQTGLFGKDNDTLVYLINHSLSHDIKAYLPKVFNNILPVIRDAAVHVIYHRDKSSLVRQEMYDYIKQYYPQYFDLAIKDVLKEKAFYKLPFEKLDEIYSSYKSDVISAIREASKFELIATHGRRGTNILSFAINKIRNHNEPELKEALRSRMPEINVDDIVNYKLYTIFPEESKGPLLSRPHSVQDMKIRLDIARFIPEFKEKVNSILLSNPSSLFSDASSILEIFSEEERREIYNNLTKEESDRIFYKLIDSLRTTNNKEEYGAILTIKNEIPQETWDRLALDLSISYFFSLDILDYIDLSENVIQEIYKKSIYFLKESPYNAEKISESQVFNRLLDKYGLSDEQINYILSIENSWNIIKNNPRLKDELERYIEVISEKIFKGQETTPDEILAFKNFIVRGYLRNSSNKILNYAIPFVEKNQDIGNNYGIIRQLNIAINKPEHPDDKNQEKVDISKDSILSYLRILENTTRPNIPDNLYLLKRTSEELDDNFLKEYCRLIAKVNPRDYFMSNGKNISVYDNNMNEEVSFDYYVNDYLNLDLSTFSNEQIANFKENFYKNKDKFIGHAIPLVIKYPQFIEIGLKNITFGSSESLNIVFNTILGVFKDIKNIPTSIIKTLYNNLINDDRLFFDILHANDSRGISKSDAIDKLSIAFPDIHRAAIKVLAKNKSSEFLNSQYGQDRRRFESEIILAIENLQKEDFTNHVFIPSVNEFFIKKENQDLLEKLLRRAESVDALGDLLMIMPQSLDFARSIGIDIEQIGVEQMRNINDYEKAKKIFPLLKNDLPIKNLPPEIKISQSIYQDQQRPEILSKNFIRYTISNNNIEPTKTLYDIGKKLIHAGDGVGHENVGVSGFTNSWSLVTFADVENQPAIIIEQYQSDYPPVLSHLFHNKSVTGEDGEDYHNRGKEALQRLIRQYGDQEAIQEYISQYVYQPPEIPESIKNIKVEDFGFSHSTFKRLQSENINTIGELLVYTRNDLLRMGSIGRRALKNIEETLAEYDLALPKRSAREIPSPDDIELPIELAPEVKDARTHFEYISKAYPYLSIINTIKVAQNQNIDYIYLLANAPELANIQNKEKAKKLYEDIPSKLGELINDEELGLDLWKIPANEQTIQMLKAMLQEEVGKEYDYNFALTPAQNQELKEKGLQEMKRKKQEWVSTPEKQNRLIELEQEIRDKLPMIEVPNFYSPQQALKFLGENVRGKVLSKRTFNIEFADISRELGLLARATRRHNRMIKVASILRKIDAKWSDGVPTFDWLNHGMIGKFKAKYPYEFEEFLDANSDKFAIWDPQKYLGSGLFGDAWLLRDGRVLKIFDANAYQNGKNDLDKYREIEDLQYQGRANPSLPKIYEYGMLDLPLSLRGLKSVSPRNYTKSFAPAYVIMEGVKTPSSMVNEYIEYNPYLLEPSLVYNEEEDDWLEREKSSDEFVEKISEEEVPYDLKDEYYEMIMGDLSYEDFLRKFVESTLNQIIFYMNAVYEEEMDKFQEQIDAMKYSGQEEFDNEEAIDFREPHAKEYLVEIMANFDHYIEYPEETVGAMERVLNLEKGWEKELARAVINNLDNKRTDLHAGNFGFRNGHVVFFDA